MFHLITSHGGFSPIVWTVNLYEKYTRMLLFSAICRKFFSNEFIDFFLKVYWRIVSVLWLDVWTFITHIWWFLSTFYTGCLSSCLGPNICMINKYFFRILELGIFYVKYVFTKEQVSVNLTFELYNFEALLI